MIYPQNGELRNDGKGLGYSFDNLFMGVTGIFNVVDQPNNAKQTVPDYAICTGPRAFITAFHKRQSGGLEGHHTEHATSEYGQYARSSKANGSEAPTAL